MSWHKVKILIYGKTYPEISSRYVETVCTGGILESDFSFIRLYPIPFRYLENDKQFRKYQWIEAEIKKHTRDQRPESYMVKLESIRVLNEVGTGKKQDWEDRKRLFIRSQNTFQSLEELQSRQEENGTSIGLIKPKHIHDFYIRKKSEKEYRDSLKKRDEVLKQEDMFMKFLDHEIPKIKFYFKFECDDPICSGHEISVLDWEFYELYRKTKNDENWFNKMKDKVMGYCSDKRETYFFMGNLADPTRRNVFCISGLFYPPKTDQLALL